FNISMRPFSTRHAIGPASAEFACLQNGTSTPDLRGTHNQHRKRDAPRLRSPPPSPRRPTHPRDGERSPWRSTTGEVDLSLHRPDCAARLGPLGTQDPGTNG